MNPVLHNFRKIALFAGAMLFTLFMNFGSLFAQPFAMAPACDAPSSAAGSITGLNISIGTAVNTAANGIDGNAGTAAVFNIGIGGGLGITWHENAALNGLYTGNVYVSMSLSSSALSANILSGINVVAYNGTTQVWSVQMGSSLASWFINVGSVQSGVIAAPNNNPYDHIDVQYTAGVSLGFIGEIMRVYEVRRIPFKPVTSVSASNTSLCNPAATLAANVSNITSNDLSYAWYTNGTQIAATQSINVAPTSTTTYTVITTIDGACTFPATPQKDTAVFTLAPPPPLSVDITSACSGMASALTAALTGGNAVTYAWTASDGGTISGDADVATVDYTSNGTYTVTITTDNVCLATQSFTVTNYDPSACGATTPIQIEGNFTATQVKSAVSLAWKTKSEINNKEFEILKSTDGQSFTHFATVASKAKDGNSTSPLEYSATDESPVNGINYYQLKQYDLDGKSAIVQTTSINVAGVTSELSVFPNPATTELNLKGVTSGSSYKIFSLAGKEIVPLTTVSGTTVSLKNIASGIYILQIYSKDKKVKAVKFIKQ